MFMLYSRKKWAAIADLVVQEDVGGVGCGCQVAVGMATPGYVLHQAGVASPEDLLCAVAHADLNFAG